MARKPMGEVERAQMVLQAAKLHYVDGLNKSDVSHRLGTSVTQVIRFIDEAIDKKIVRIEIFPPKLEKLSAEVKERFPFLRKVIVTASTSDLEYDRKMRGKAAADYFDEIVKPGMKVGIGGGRTLHEMIAALPERERDMDIYPTALIGRGPTILHLDPMVQIAQLWTKNGSQYYEKKDKAHYTTVPPYQADCGLIGARKLNAQLRKNNKVEEVFQGMKTVDVVFTGIGSVKLHKEQTEQTIHSTMRLIKEMGEEKRVKDAVGDISYIFIDKDGNTRKDWDFFLTLDLEKDLKRMAKEKEVVVVATHRNTDTLRAILKGNICSTLIINDKAAQDLLEPA